MATDKIGRHFLFTRRRKFFATPHLSFLSFYKQLLSFAAIATNDTRPPAPTSA